MNTEKRNYDLIVIGGGSGGLAVAEKAIEYGASVAVIENGALGGTCVNNGCVPKKIMWYAAELANSVDDAPAFGIPARREATDWGALVNAREKYIASVTGYWNDYVGRLAIERIQGFARFTGPRTVTVDGHHYSAEHIVIATGGKPIVPKLPGAELGMTSDDFFALRTQPRHVAVIGGGYIGVELSGVVRALGSRVSLIALEDRLLERFDGMISQVLQKNMERQGIQVHTRFQVSALRKCADGLRVAAGDDGQLGGFDAVIWAVGRGANSQGLDLAVAGVESLANGLIPVDEFQNTNIPGVYAIGDVTGKAALTPVAISAGRRLAERLFNGQATAKADYANVPSVVFSHPPIATIGMSETQARDQFGDGVTVYQTEFTPMRHALTEHAASTAMKLVCAGAEERLVGIHIIGSGADEMLQGFAVALKMGARKQDLDKTMAIHPTSAEELVTMKTPRPEDVARNTREWRQAS